MEWVKVTRSGAAPEGGYRISCEEREGHDAEIKTSAPTGESRRDGRLGSRGRTPEKLGKELETSAQTIRNWVKEADPDAWTGTDALTTEEREELRRLRRENRQLKMEREVLTESVAWSAWETGSIPDEHPSS